MPAWRSILSYSSLRAWRLQGCAQGHVTGACSTLRAWRLLCCAHGHDTLSYSSLGAWRLLGCAQGCAGVQVEKYRLQLELLREGRLVEAMAVRTGGNRATDKVVKGMEDAAGDPLHPFTSCVPPLACPCILRHEALCCLPDIPSHDVL